MRPSPVLVLLLAAAPASSLACSSCGCTLSSDWVSQGMDSHAGFSADLRYDYIDQSALRSGTESAPVPALPADNEVEHRTTNRYITAALGYNPDKDWGVSLLLPWLDRSHSTYGETDTEQTLSHTRSLGDVRLVARYQGFSADHDSGLLWGVKLPTGATDRTFNGGPGAGGDLDRSLQPGTGSTDLILGGFRFGSLNRDWDWYMQAMFQTAVHTRDDFRPGNSTLLNAGLRYMSLGRLVPQLQANFIDRRRDGGANGDPDNTGGDLLYVSPGLSVRAGRKLDVYGFVQLPVYQHVYGMQLTPRWNVSAGVSYRFN